MINTIVLDPGHCAKWSGARGNVLGVYEHLVVLKICLIMKDYFDAHGISSLLTHNTPLYLDARSREFDLAARFNFAYSRRLPIFSLHCNSAVDTNAYGYECYTLPGQDASDAWATAVLCHYQQMFPNQRMRADSRDGDLDKEANLAVLRQRRANLVLRNTGILFELPFLSNRAEEAWLANANNYPNIARALCDGTIAWLKNFT